MKKKRFQIWRESHKKFGFWSKRVRGFGLEGKSRTTVIILNPTGSPKTVFSIGFSDVSGNNSKISNATRRVEEGPFGMRMGRNDCDFFIVSNNGEVGLELVEYANINDITKSELRVY